MRRIKLLVCGGRDYGDACVIHDELDRFSDNLDGEIKVIITGGATGIDRFAETWGYINRCFVWSCPAYWDGVGKSAGPIRNSEMLEFAKPDIVLAFPGGRGTANMVKQSRVAGVGVVTIVLDEEEKESNVE